MSKLPKYGVEKNFDLTKALWEEYVEWCEGGYVVHGADRRVIGISNKPTREGFKVWKRAMGYFTEPEEDE